MKKLECNKPVPAPAGSKKKMKVRACENGQEKTLQFGARGYSDFTKHKDEKRKDSFHARHKCSEKKSKLKAGYWACNKLW